MNTRIMSHHWAVNVGKKERLLSLFGGGALIAYGLKRRSWDGWLLAALGGDLVYRGATGHCEIYHALGINQTRQGRNVSVPYESGIRVDGSVAIERPAEEVYYFWRNLENLPKFMTLLESVQEIDNRISHWVAKGPAGLQLQWKAEIINDIPKELIGWRSLPGAEVANAGSVHFTGTPDGNGTVVKVEVQYDPPGGVVGAMVAKMVGNDPEKLLSQDLQRLRSMLESGSESTAQKKQPRKGWNRDQVLTASEESFPASDPPSWTPTAL
jgi:uncharacterized membrane protein